MKNQHSIAIKYVGLPIVVIAVVLLIYHIRMNTFRTDTVCNGFVLVEEKGSITELTCINEQADNIRMTLPCRADSLKIHEDFPTEYVCTSESGRHRIKEMSAL